MTNTKGELLAIMNPITSAIANQHNKIERRSWPFILTTLITWLPVTSLLIYLVADNGIANSDLTYYFFGITFLSAGWIAAIAYWTGRKQGLRDATNIAEQTIEEIADKHSNK
jgi:hypothetical protein